MNQRESYQQGTLVRIRDTWTFRYRERLLNGDVKHRAEIVGTVEQYPTRSKAEKAAEKIRERINEKKPAVTFKELAGRFERDVIPTIRAHTQATNRGNLKYLREKFDDRRLDDIKTGEIDLWLNTLKSRTTGKELSKQTRRHIRNLAHNLWRHAMLWEYLSPVVNPLSLVRVTKGAGEKPRSTVYVDADIYRRLMADEELIPVAKMIVLVAMTTGMGISEILGLKWEDSIDFRKGVIHVLRSVDGKNINETKNEFREAPMPMHPDLAKALRKWQKEDGCFGGWVFGSPQTDRPYHASIMLADHLRPAGKRAGCPKLGWHSFRHTFSAAMELAKVSDRVQQRTMRHGNAGMTRKYGKYSPALFEAAREAQAAVVDNLKTGSK